MRNKLAAVGAIITAGLASVCCIGPIVLAALGLGGIGFAAGLDRYRPYFLGAMVVFLGLVFYRTYRQDADACAAGSCAPGSGKPMKVALWVIAALAAGMATFPNWVTLVTRRSLPVAVANAQTVKLSVSGMDCAACTIGIEQSLKKIPGVMNAAIDFSKGEATVVVERGKVDISAFVRAVESSGPYQAQLRGIN